jgi:hypothetical protein
MTPKGSSPSRKQAPSVYRLAAACQTTSAESSCIETIIILGLARLADPGPYQLPLCSRAAVHILDSSTAQLILDTDHGQRILVPLRADALVSLGDLISFVLNQGKKPTP